MAATRHVTSPRIEVSRTTDHTKLGKETPAASAYHTPRLFVAGSAVELVQGSWGPVKDVGGYNTYP
jgi:hypothetical protein